ncbi:MAG: YfiR family protein [Magnetococcales bacterium]|nr:YfiR family protein [Magnetococcales bacterium]
MVFPPSLWSAVFLLSMIFGTVCAEQPTEYQVKGAYLYNFTKFITWPSTAFTDDQAPFRLCVLGDNPFGSALEALTKKTTQNHPITILYLEAVQQAAQCHLLFITQAESEKISAILTTIQKKPILTVGDRADFARQGGMIHFVNISDNLKFAINLETVLQAGLKVNATLLQVGHVIP